jgi:hypothetical protein
MTPAQIRDGALLELLGDILRPETDRTGTGLLRLRLMRQGSSWQALVDLARGQGVLLPLIFALNARGLLPPLPRSIAYSGHHVTARLGALYEQHLAWRRAQTGQLEKVLGVLARAGVGALALKGARYLVEPSASWCEARPMADFDLLVPPDGAEPAFAALTAEGYRPMAGSRFIPGFSHHLPALEHPHEPAAVELHVRSLSPAGERIMSTEHVWARSVAARDRSCLVLPVRWHALHGLLHHQIQDRGHAQRALNIRALWEWAMLASTFTVGDWDAVEAHMHAARASDVLDSWLVQAQRIFKLDIPRRRAVSSAARTHADATYRSAGRPYWQRRIRYIAEQLRVSFAPETLALKYRTRPSRPLPLLAFTNLLDLLRVHRGKVLQRLTGHRDRLG